MSAFLICYNMFMNEPSVFTKIINGEIPCYTIYEDERVFAFLDIHPINPGHVLIVPKVQIDHIWDLDEDDYKYLMEIVKKIANHIRSTIQCPRVGMAVEGFGVPHAHVHLIPIYQGNDLKKPQDDKDAPIDDAGLAAMAKKLAMF